jgi:hypothetical protein
MKLCTVENLFHVKVSRVENWEVKLHIETDLIVHVDFIFKSNQVPPYLLATAAEFW